MNRLLSLILVLSSTLLSCGQRAPSIDFGKAECAHCRMNVVDQRFGAAIITAKGRQYVFDDIVCMVQFADNGTVAEEQVAGWYVCDHAHPGTLIDATTAHYKHGQAFRSPMRGDVAGFATAKERDMAAEGIPLNWQDARKKLLE